MKKVLLVFAILLLAGCKSELICTLNSTEENYESEIKTFFEFDGDKIINAYSINTMTFQTEEEVESYFSILGTLDDSYNVTKKNSKQIQIKVSKNYDIYNDDKELIIEEYEKDGYSCK